MNRYLKDDISKKDIVWSYSGVRPLYDDGAMSATAATRDYVLSLDEAGPPILSVFGGKITTYRKLAEQAMEKLKPFYETGRDEWTAGVALPGGDFKVEDFDALVDSLKGEFPFLSAFWARRLVRAYGTDAWLILGTAKTAEELGEDFGATLTEAEVKWLVRKEFARSAEDIVWRRSKLGLRLTKEQVARLAETMPKPLVPAVQ